MDLTRFLEILTEKKVSQEIAEKCLNYLNTSSDDVVARCQNWLAEHHPASTWENGMTETSDSMRVFDWSQIGKRITCWMDDGQTLGINIVVIDDNDRCLSSRRYIADIDLLCLLPVLKKHLIPKNFLMIMAYLNNLSELPSGALGENKWINHMKNNFDEYKPHLLELAGGPKSAIRRPFFFEVGFYAEAWDDIRPFTDCATESLTLGGIHNSWQSLQKSIAACEDLGIADVVNFECYALADGVRELTTPVITAMRRAKRSAFIRNFVEGSVFPYDNLAPAHVTLLLLLYQKYHRDLIIRKYVDPEHVTESVNIREEQLDAAILETDLMKAILKLRPIVLSDLLSACGI